MLQPSHPAAAPATRPRAAIYARFSTDMQNPRSAEDQVRVCRDLAAREGWDVVETFTDLAISGTTTNRPGLTALLAAADGRHIDIVVAEALDRVARDQADTATIFKRFAFADCRIVTVSEGPISELHVGLLGTMNALFVKELANKIRRGQRGTVARGLVPGGQCYGYRAVPKIVDGVIERGHREIVEEEAAIVRRIFAETLAGDSPFAIVKRLNAEGIPPPRGTIWRPTTLSGTRERRNGILHNPAYAGRIAYNRVSMRKNPETRRRVSRANNDQQVVEVEAEHLRIVDESTWQAVQAEHRANKGVPVHLQRRPKHVLSGLARCADCGGAYTVISRDRWGCGNHKAGGPCTNARRIATARLEERVFSGLQNKLLAPDVVAAVVKRYHEARAREQSKMEGNLAAAEKRVAELQQEIERLVDAMASGAIALDVMQTGIARRRESLAIAEAQLAEHRALRPIILHPQIVESYRRRIALLGKAMADGAKARQFLPVIRALIDTITIADDPAQPDKARVEVTGSLASVLALAGHGSASKPAKRTVMLVAEERYALRSPLKTFRA